MAAAIMDAVTTVYEGPAVIVMDAGDLETTIALDVEFERRPHGLPSLGRWSGSFDTKEFRPDGECVVRLPGGGEGRGLLALYGERDELISYRVFGDGPPPPRT